MSSEFGEFWDVLVNILMLLQGPPNSRWSNKIRDLWVSFGRFCGASVKKEILEFLATFMILNTNCGTRLFIA